MAEGALVLVVGPSGAGKDTLIGAAQRALAGDRRFVFPRRVVTREADAALEDHASLDREAFAAARAGGEFALDWEAHGLCYGLPRSMDEAVAEGCVVVANVSRRVIPAAVAKYPRCTVLVVTADPAERARRLAARGRESAAEVTARLAREGAPVPDGITPVVIDNSGSLEASVAAFVAAVRKISGELSAG